MPTSERRPPARRSFLRPFNPPAHDQTRRYFRRFRSPRDFRPYDRHPRRCDPGRPFDFQNHGFSGRPGGVAAPANPGTNLPLRRFVGSLAPNRRRLPARYPRGRRRRQRAGRLLQSAPIHVARAEATRDGEVLKIIVVLEDVGYPGSSYTLTWSPTERLLSGEYYQATLQEIFEVTFTRLP
jgi:hypothetical protein